MKVDPEYSVQARSAKLSGTVQLSAIVGPDGRAHAIGVVKGLGLGLDEKAIEAVSKWRFNPGKTDGRPVPVRMTIELNFRTM